MAREMFIRWWRQPDHYAWLVQYLQDRGISRHAQRPLAVVAASLVLMPVNTVWGPEALHRNFLLGTGVLAVAAGLVFFWIWWHRWPTRNQSVLFAMTGSALIAIGCLEAANPLIGLMSCTALAVPGGYTAFFHTAPIMSANFAIAATVGAVQALRLASGGEAVLAASGYLLVLELNIGVPLAVQAVTLALRIDVLQSDQDPLTGLLNRRAFQRAVVASIAAREGDAYLAVAIVDLDRFKQLNDTEGHMAGDEALTSVGAALRLAAREGAAIGRIGGEEFAVAEVRDDASINDFGERLCQAISQTRSSITASVGVSATAVKTRNADDIAEMLAHLIARADIAMYGAKRAGGNRCHYSDIPGETR